MISQLNIKRLSAVLCILLITGLAMANCGNCPGDEKKCCGNDGQCCKKVEDQKACAADCQKPCCAKSEAKCCGEEGKCCKEACPVDCQKVCCALKVAPDFTLMDINGKEVQLSKLEDKIVVLEWTNYDCPFVKPHYAEDTRTMSKLAKKYAKDNVVWLTINSTHYAAAEDSKAWAEKHNLKQTVLVDSDGKVGKLYKAKTTPHLFVIDKEGKIAYQGAIDNAPRGKVPEGEEYVNYVDKAISALLNDQAVSTPFTKPYGCTVKYAKKEG